MGWRSTASHQTVTSSKKGLGGQLKSAPKRYMLGGLLGPLIWAAGQLCYAVSFCLSYTGDILTAVSATIELLESLGLGLVEALIVLRILWPWRSIVLDYLYDYMARASIGDVYYLTEQEPPGDGSNQKGSGCEIVLKRRISRAEWVVMKPDRGLLRVNLTARNVNREFRDDIDVQNMTPAELRAVEMIPEFLGEPDPDGAGGVGLVVTEEEERPVPQMTRAPLPPRYQALPQPWIAGATRDVSGDGFAELGDMLSVGRWRALLVLVASVSLSPRATPI